MQRRLGRTVWNTGGCVSWYRDELGRNPTLWPGATFAYKYELRRFDVREHVLDFADRKPADASLSGASAGFSG
jgi:cyclohexanone monooxygenase